MERKFIRVVVKGDKFKVARAMADAGVPFAFRKEAGANTVGDVPNSFRAALSVFLGEHPEFEGRLDKYPWK